MKISLSSPDGLGDFVLRLPLIEALLRGGHHLQLLMRPPAAELACGLLPEADVHVIGRDPWHKETQRLLDPFEPDFDAIREFRPDVFVVAAFQPTYFDRQWLASDSGRTRSVGFTPAGCGDEQTPPWSVAVSVPVAMPEAEKCRHLASGIVGRKLDFGPPRRPSPANVDAAKGMLAEIGFPASGFLVVCVGTRPGLILKDWGQTKWTRLLVAIAREDRRPLLFLGNPKEAASIERIRAALPSGTVSASLASCPPPMPLTHALISLSDAYLGRDSGPMHLAAATGRPLLALFGGGHWPRFVPPAARGVVLTRATPCRGCNFDCPFPEPYCVAGIPEEAVLGAWRSMAGARTLRVVEIPPEESWLEMHRKVTSSQNRRGSVSWTQMVRNAWNRMTPDP